MAYMSFFAGILLMFLIDAFVPPHAYMGERCDLRDRPDNHQDADKARLTRAGVLLAVGIAIHNFPEGMASFAGAIQDRHLGIAIAFAIALHNIPPRISRVSADVLSHRQSPDCLPLGFIGRNC